MIKQKNNEELSERSVFVFEDIKELKDINGKTFQIKEEVEFNQLDLEIKKEQLENRIGELQAELNDVNNKLNLIKNYGKQRQ